MDDWQGTSETVETDDRFPSGRWTGWYTQYGRKWSMRLEITFRDGNVNATGSDPVGVFTMSGKYDTDTGRVGMTKTYTGRPDLVRVLYNGLSGDQGIRGTWEFALILGNGAFHIWPSTGSEDDGIIASIEREIDWESGVHEDIPVVLPV